MPNIFFKISRCQKPSGLVLNIPQLTISITMITGYFEYALKSAD